MWQVWRARAQPTDLWGGAVMADPEWSEATRIRAALNEVRMARMALDKAARLMPAKLTPERLDSVRVSIYLLFKEVEESKSV